MTDCENSCRIYSVNSELLISFTQFYSTDLIVIYSQNVCKYYLIACLCVPNYSQEICQHVRITSMKQRLSPPPFLFVAGNCTSLDNVNIDVNYINIVLSEPVLGCHADKKCKYLIPRSNLMPTFPSNLIKSEQNMDNSWHVVISSA